MTLLARLFFRLLRVCLATGFFFVATSPAHSQTVLRTSADYLIHVWRSEDGLPQNSVNCLAQTPDGYLWVGTRSGGLARFDGIRFVTFNPQSTPELKDVEFETLSTDSLGTLWITAGNESIANLTDGKFRLVREPNAAPRWHPCQLIGEDANSVFLSGYAQSIFRVPREGVVNDMFRIDLAPPPPDPQPGQFSQAPDGAFWYVTDRHQVARFQFISPSNTQFKIFDLGTPVEMLVKNAVGEIWVAAGARVGTMGTNGFIDRTPTNGRELDTFRQIAPGKGANLWVWNGRRLSKISNGKWTLSVAQFQPTSSQQLRFFPDSQDG